MFKKSSLQSALPVLVGSGLGGLSSAALYQYLRNPKKQNMPERLLAIASGMGAGGLAGNYFKNELDRVTAEMQEAGRIRQEELETGLNS